VDAFDAATKEVTLHLSPRTRAMPPPPGHDPEQLMGRFELPAAEAAEDEKIDGDGSGRAQFKEHGKQKGNKPVLMPAVATQSWSDLINVHLCVEQS
jgi:hypothetical protein